ncbi:MAG: hypothetical protein RIM99_14715 [Cyclobacteriaceae bacterium]
MACNHYFPQYLVASHMEFSYVNRYGEWLDFLSNAAGIIIGFLPG